MKMFYFIRVISLWFSSHLSIIGWCETHHITQCLLEKSYPVVRSIRQQDLKRQPPNMHLPHRVLLPDQQHFTPHHHINNHQATPFPFSRP